MHARLRRRPLACRPRRATTARPRSRKGSSSAASPTRPAPRSCSRRRTRMPPGTHYPRTDERDRLYAESLAEMRAEVAAWGLDLRRGWEVYPSEVAGARSRRPRARGHPRGPDRVPGLLARHRGSDRGRRRGGRAGRGGGARAGARPSRSVAAPSRTIPRASARSPSGAGSSASTRRRSSAGTAPRPSARRGRCSTPGSSRSPPRTATRSRGRRRSTWRIAACVSAAATRSRGRCSTAAPFPGS